MARSFICRALIFMPIGELPSSSSAITLRPVVVVVAPMRLRIVSWLGRGLPCQFLVIWENKRCSILFHLLVPGGRWQTLMSRPVSAARAASSVFQVRRRLPLEPPESAVMNNRAAWGYAPAPTVFHHERKVLTANAAVSWSTPTLTQPVLAPTS